MATLAVQVYDGNNWQTVEATEAVVVNRVGLAEARLLVPAASLATRSLLRSGREAHITLSEGGYAMRFAGYLENPSVASVAPGQMDLDVSCVGLEAGASWRNIFSKTYPDALEVKEPFRTQPLGEYGFDSYVDQDYPDTNFGGAATLKVSNVPGDLRRAFLKFDLSLIPAGSRIERARLSIRLQSTGSTYISSNIELYAVTGDWAEHSGYTYSEARGLYYLKGLTWNNQPATEAKACATALVGQARGLNKMQFHVWDITELVQRWVDGDIPNYGVMLKASETDKRTDSKEFRSSETASGLLAPILTATFVRAIPYSEAIKDIWRAAWPEINTSKVPATSQTFSQALALTYTSLTKATERLLARLEGYSWWLEWNGTTTYLRAEKRGYTTTGKTLQEQDVSGTYEMEATNPDPRNVIIVLGGAGDGNEGEEVDRGDNEPTLPVKAVAFDSASMAYYGTRPYIVEKPGAQTFEEADALARTELAARAREYFKIRFSSTDYALQVGQKVTVSLACPGIDGVNYRNEYAVEEIEDTYSRGRLVRLVTLKEVPIGD